MVKLLLRLVLMLSLPAACGGVTGGPVLAPNPASFAEYTATDAALRASYVSAPYADPASLPGSGSATYDGVMTLDAGLASGNLAMTGALALTAQFATSTISGHADAFRDAANRAYTGQLSLSNGVIDRGADPNSAYTFSADLAGTLSGNGATLAMTADLSGDFLDVNAQAVAGVVSGSTVSGGHRGYLYGDFVAQD